MWCALWMGKLNQIQQKNEKMAGGSLLGEQSCHIFWKGHMKFHGFLRNRMRKGESIRMQRYPVDFRKIRMVEIIS